MPNVIERREAFRGYAPAAVLTLIGAQALIDWGYYVPSVAHIKGPNGPRGGTRTVCGRHCSVNWVQRPIQFPTNPRSWRSGWLWGRTCPDCKAALGGLLAPA